MKLLNLGWAFFLFVNIQAQKNNVLLCGNSDCGDGIGSMISSLSAYCSEYDVVPYLDSQKIKKDKKYALLFYTEQNIFRRILIGQKTFEGYFDEIKDIPLRIAWSVMERVALPRPMKKDLNTYFDCVVVPDPFLANMYKESGIIKPVFCIPQGFLLEVPSLENDHKKAVNKEKMVFTLIARNFWYKNIHKAVEAFHEVFKENSSVFLKIHCRDALCYNALLKDLLKKLNNKNIHLDEGHLSAQEYTDFLNESDCFVSLSQGEGFAIPPRQALSLGIPCILSNNTAHSTICKTGYVLPVKADIKYHLYSQIGGLINGDLDCAIETEVCDCTFDDAVKAYKEMYNNYALYLKKAENASMWARQFTWKNVMDYYDTLFNPYHVIFGNQNSIVPETKTIITDDVPLYNKLVKLLPKGSQ